MSKTKETKKIDMNLPNKLTIFRMLLIPVILVIYATIKNLAVANGIILAIFLVGTFTDFLDGHIARKEGLVTNFGKFMDPLADKLLVMTVMVILLQQNINIHKTNPEALQVFEWWMLIIILAREFMVTGVRTLGASANKVIAASKFGKYKALSQYVTLSLVLVYGIIFASASDPTSQVIYWFGIGCKVALYITLILTIFSGVDYIVKNKEIFYEENKKKGNK